MAELDPRTAGAQRLRDKVCVVTSAGQGIGRATARRLGEVVRLPGYQRWTMEISLCVLLYPQAFMHMGFSHIDLEIYHFDSNKF